MSLWMPLIRDIKLWFSRMPSSGMWCNVYLVNWTDVSEERITSIFRVEKSASEEPTWAGGSRRLLPPAHVSSSLADFSTLKMEAIRSSENSVQFTKVTRCHIPEDGILHSHRCENFKSYIWFSSLANTVTPSFLQPQYSFLISVPLIRSHALTFSPLSYRRKFLSIVVPIQPTLGGCDVEGSHYVHPMWLIINLGVRTIFNSLSDSAY
jgi:hypothetical protein